MKTSDQGIIALIGHEGVVPGPYKDSVGVFTYGVGHTSAAGAPDPSVIKAGMPDDLDKELANVFRVFKSDLARYEQAVDRAITVPVSQHEFDAAVSFHFNTGAIAKASWVKKLNAMDRSGAAAGIMNWKKPPEIIPRRQSEQRLFRNGVYPDDRIVVWKVAPNYKVIWKAAKYLSAREALLLLGGDDPLSSVFDEEFIGDPTPGGNKTGLGKIFAAIVAFLGGRK